jgi:hypothetical protein
MSAAICLACGPAAARAALALGLWHAAPLLQIGGGAEADRPMEPNLCAGISMSMGPQLDLSGSARRWAWHSAPFSVISKVYPRWGKTPHPKGGGPKGQTTERIGEALKSSAAPSPSNNRMFGLGIEWGHGKPRAAPARTLRRRYAFPFAARFRDACVEAIRQ